MDPYPAKVAVFDVDGTLTATTGVDDECLARAWSSVFGMAADSIDTDWTHYTHSTDQGLTLEVCRRGLGRNPSPGEFACVKEAFFGLLRERIGGDPALCVAVPGARELLAELRRRGFAVGIASGAWEESARIKLGAAGVEVDGFPGTFSHARADGEPALREEIIAGTLGRLGVPAGAAPGRAVYVGDGIWDARAARALRLGFVGIRLRGDNARMEGEGVTRIVRDFTDLTATLELIDQAIGHIRPI